MYKVLIDDSIEKDGGSVLSFDLTDILDLIKDGSLYQWAISDLEINYLQNDNPQNDIPKNVREKLEEIKDINNFRIDFEGLKKMWGHNIQTINGLFTANRQNSYIIITAFDSSYWMVETNSMSLINSIYKRFESVVDKFD